MSDHRISKTQLINDPQKLRPHIVIVGSGASVASFPKGDKNGKQLPTMDNLVEVIGLKKIFDKHGFSPSDLNFESLYSDLHLKNPNSELIKDIENSVYDYFSSLNLPNRITLYDHLLLCLREKDVVATFNWDPFLYDSWERCKKYAPIPQPIFLHGNVRIGHCPEDDLFDGINSPCPECGKSLQPIKLLYPVKEKNYDSDIFIRSEWEYLRKKMENAFTLTIFGYGAPATDIEAFNLMKIAWKAQSQRTIEMVEFIDLKEKNELSKQWEPFLFSHHYRCYENFYDSHISNSARRTCESLLHPTIYGKFVEWYPLPKNLGFEKFIDWLEPFIMVENIKNWRLRWLKILYEFTHLDYQKGLWVENKYSNMSSSYYEDICQYFDDIAIDGDYTTQLNDGYIDKTEYELIKEFHKKLGEYDPGNKTDIEILNDTIWRETIELGFLAWSNLKSIISDTGEKEYISKLESMYLS